MKFNSKIRRSLRWKYAMLMFLLSLVLTLIALPCVAAEKSDSVHQPIHSKLLVQSPETSGNADEEISEIIEVEMAEPIGPPEAPPDSVGAPQRLWADTIAMIPDRPRSLYNLPASWTRSEPYWHGMWINTAVLSGAFIGTLFVLELLPEDATTWNRASLRRVPFYKRWYRNVFKRGPEWDHDNPIFNYVLHPYAGAAYFMGARTCGFNFWQSMLYSAIISTVGWEFGIEACMERPSYQDLFVTPIIGSLLGEGCYRAKRFIVDNDYELLGSPVLGHIVAFFLDPLNEVMGYFNPGKCRNIGPGCFASEPLLIPAPLPGESKAFGFRLSATF